MISTKELLGREPLPEEVLYRDDYAAGLFAPIDQLRWEVHYGAAKCVRGYQAMQRFNRWIKQFWNEHPEARLLIGVIKPDNHAARHGAVHLGFTYAGTHTLPWADKIKRPTACYTKIRP